LASIIGAEELSESDRQYLNFAGHFEKRFIKQGEEEDRSIIETLSLAWDALSLLPQAALIRVTEKDLEKYYKGESNAGQDGPKEELSQLSASEES
jgi:V/A-type H+-transporting ATPase subunit B